MAARTALLETSKSLHTALKGAQEDIQWAEAACQIFDGIQAVYSAFSGAGVLPSQLSESLVKVCELERYVLIDLHRHIAVGNGRAPYYLERIGAILSKLKELFSAMVASQKGKEEYEGCRQSLKDLDHLNAELQTSFLEYGFCCSFEVLYNIEEANRRLDAVDIRLKSISQALANDNTTLAIVELHDVIAEQHGVQQVLTEANMLRIKKRYDEMTNRITRCENTIYNDKLQNGSSVLEKYVQVLKNANEEFINVLEKSDPIDVINNNLIHPGTRAWLLERIQRYLFDSKKRIFYLAGREGTGKTAMASTVCKLYGAQVIGEHFFNSAKGNVPVNSVRGLIQSLSADMCRTSPAYQEQLREQYGSMGAGFKVKLRGGWESLYELLLKSPLTALYGGAKAGLCGRRRMLVIDGLDEVVGDEWEDMKAFLTAYMRDMSPMVCILATVRTESFSSLMPLNEDLVEGIRLEDRMYINRHIKDIEVYLAGCLGAILSGEDEVDTPCRAKADEMTLQSTVDELLKASAGRFDYAIELMESFAGEMTASGQFLTSLKRAMLPIRKTHAREFENNTSDFASPFRAYRDKEGRSVSVRVMRQSQYPMDKSRVALIRGRHMIKELQQ